MTQQEIDDFLQTVTTAYAGSNKATRIGDYNQIKKAFDGEPAFINDLKNMLEKAAFEPDKKATLYNGLMSIYSDENTIG